MNATSSSDGRQSSGSTSAVELFAREDDCSVGLERTTAPEPVHERPGRDDRAGVRAAASVGALASKKRGSPRGGRGWID